MSCSFISCYGNTKCKILRDFNILKPSLLYLSQEGEEVLTSKNVVSTCSYAVCSELLMGIEATDNGNPRLAGQACSLSIKEFTFCPPMFFNFLGTL